MKVILEYSLKVIPSIYNCRLRRFDEWKEKMESNLYDFKLISSRLNALKQSLDNKDVPNLKLLIRSGLLRNLGNITHPLLFSHSAVGTKTLIEDYLRAVVESIHFLAFVDEPLQKKAEYFYIDLGILR